MKLFIALGSFFPAQTGGADNSAYWMARALTKEGFSISVATTNSGLGKNDVVYDRWTKTDFGEVVYAKTLIHYLPLKLFWFSLRRALRADVVHLNAIFYPISIMLASVCTLAGKQIIWSIHGELAPKTLSHSAFRKKIIISLVKLLKHKVIFHATSPVEETYVRNIFGNDVKVRVVPLYIELPEPLPRKANEKYLLFVGRIHPLKALERLLDALGSLSEFKEQGWKLKLVGKGDASYLASLKEQVKHLNLTDNVEFVGFRNGIEKYQLMADAYATVMPSYSENFSIMVLESLVQGTPVIASIYTPWEILRENKAGWWTDNDVPTLRKTLQEAMALSEEEYRQYRKNAYIVAHAKFDIKTHIGELISLYDPNVSQRSKHPLEEAVASRSA